MFKDKLLASDSALTQAFLRLDKDHSGYLDRDEVVQVRLQLLAARFVLMCTRP